MEWQRMPPMTALRAFAAYAETGSVTQAGRALNVSHAAISQQIKSLEGFLGVPLLDRTGRQMQMTEQGRELADACFLGFGAIANMVDQLTQLEDDRPIQLSTTPLFAASWLMPRLADFRQKHPEISLMVDPSPELRPLQPGGIDLAVRYCAGGWPGLEAHLLVQSAIVVIASPSLIGHGPIEDPAELLKYPWLQEMGTNEATTWMREQGVAQALPRGLTSLPGNLLSDAARDGQGIAVTARAFFEADIQAGRLRVLFQDQIEKGYYLLSRPGVRRPAVRAFHKWALRQARKDIQGL
ncbi:LysR family transcriptional regulator [Thalassovita sp.]|uniref:LysR family transcriptional regulator n=2 Tax=Thalassovita sp. TaxID=1979401 RepID=UPI0028821A6B|nr:LysR family transcriptional regulator [Thalassovita sp.]MDF1803781.1 LysR family transcriptional regulator [Thalassovita sp.]